MNIEQKVIDILTATIAAPPGVVRADSTYDSIGMDSMDSITALLEMETEFDLGISDEEYMGVRSVATATEYITKRIKQKSVLNNLTREDGSYETY